MMDIHFWNDDYQAQPKSMLTGKTADCYKRRLEALATEPHDGFVAAGPRIMADRSWLVKFPPLTDDEFRNLLGPHEFRRKASSLSEDNHSLCEGGNHV